MVWIIGDADLMCIPVGRATGAPMARTPLRRIHIRDAVRIGHADAKTIEAARRCVSDMPAAASSGMHYRAGEPDWDAVQPEGLRKVTGHEFWNGAETADGCYWRRSSGN